MNFFAKLFADPYENTEVYFSLLRSYKAAVLEL